MNRRLFLNQLSQGAALAGFVAGSGRAWGAQQPALTHPPLKITRVKAILTAPARTRLCVVKVETSEPGLYGIGCATFTQRHLTVHSAVEDFLKPFLIGKNVQCIEDLWQT